MNASLPAFTVAIDGPAASGKGTIARALATRFGFAHLDTGLLYRAVGVIAAERGEDPILIAKRLSAADLERSDLRDAGAGEAASKVAAMAEVRAVLLAFQRRFAEQPGGAVLDGRDIGTVICPDAAVKLFVTASPEARARRRHEELTAKGEAISLEAVAEDLARRDARDAGRADAPLTQAEGARLIDTTELTIEAAVAEAARWINEQLQGAREIR